jgi:uncharacterized MAPEG superfamily protein
MFICQVVVGVIVLTCSHDWQAHAAAGWVAVVFVWLYIANFAVSPSLPYTLLGRPY